jgi:hypothetical protein
MKTLTFHNSIPGIQAVGTSCARTARIVVACLFAATIALSDTLNSSVQYGIELEKKQNSITSIQENTRSIENAFKQKVENAEKDRRKGTTIEDRLGLPGNDIAALMPVSPRPAFQAPLASYGTLTPQGTTGVVNRGLMDKDAKRSGE